MKIFFHSKKILMLTYEIIYALSERDTQKPLRHLVEALCNSVRDTTNTINGVLRWGLFLSKAHIVKNLIKQWLGVEIGCMTENGSMWLNLTISYTKQAQYYDLLNSVIPCVGLRFKVTMTKFISPTDMQIHLEWC